MTFVTKIQSLSPQSGILLDSLYANLMIKCNYKPSHLCGYSMNDLGRGPRLATDPVTPAGSAASRLAKLSLSLYIYIQIIILTKSLFFRGPEGICL